MYSYENGEAFDTERHRTTLFGVIPYLPIQYTTRHPVAERPRAIQRYWTFMYMYRKPVHIVGISYWKDMKQVPYDTELHSGHPGCGAGLAEPPPPHPH